MKSGYLQKKSSGCIQRWQTRHVSHTQEKNLTIKHDESSTRCRIFTVVDVVRGDDESDLVVTCHDGKSLHLRTSSSAEREEWVQSFTRARGLTPDGPSSQPNAINSMPFSNHDIHTLNQRCPPPPTHPPPSSTVLRERVVPGNKRIRRSSDSQTFQNPSL